MVQYHGGGARSGGHAVSRHHRKLLRRLRAEWIVPDYPPRLRRCDGQWHVVFGAWSYTCDHRRAVALHLALMANSAVVASVARRCRHG